MADTAFDLRSHNFHSPENLSGRTSESQTLYGRTWTSTITAMVGVLQTEAELSFRQSRIKDWEIEQGDIPPEEPYRIETPIPVKVTRHNELDFTASFDDAGIAIGGESFHDAFQALVFELLDAFDYLLASSSCLGPEPRKQLEVLSKHIVKIDR